MDFFSFLPAIFSCIAAIALLYNGEKQEDYVGKIWCYLIGIIMVFVTVYLFEVGKEFSRKLNYKLPKTEIFYDDYSY